MAERTTTIILKEDELFTGGKCYECKSCNFKGASEYYKPIMETFRYCPMCGARITLLWE